MLDTVSYNSKNVPYASFVASKLIGQHVNFIVSKDKNAPMSAQADVDPSEYGKETVFGNFAIASYLLKGSNHDHAQASNWVEFAIEYIRNATVADFDRAAQEMNHFLQMRSFLVDNRLTLADLCVYEAIKNNRATTGYFARFGRQYTPHLLRYINFISSISEVKEADKVMGQAVKKKVSSDDILVMTSQSAYKINIQLPGAQYGKVVTRFPPEASGILHIGHGKALCINRFLADMWGGKMIFRFDDTNPAKEREEYEQGIIDDVHRLGIKYEMFSHTSDHFQYMVECAEKMIRDGNAFVDDTPKEEFTRRKQAGEESECRNNPIAKNMQMWEEMKKGTEYGKTCCLRAKFDMTSKQKTLWDPVMFRCVPLPHARTGDKFKVYPTYDFACPIVDSVEGVTHTLRTTEYNDRDEQYYRFCDLLEIRKPIIRAYSRINFYHTVMSKRKLQALVDAGIVDGWDDPRFPTIRALLRRGLTMEGFFNFVASQSSSVNVATLEWDALWSVNKRVIDPVAPRYTAIKKEELIFMDIDGVKATTRQVPKHPQNPEVGYKTVQYNPCVYLSKNDANLIKDNEEITLRNWGNVIMTNIERDDSGQVVSMKSKFHPEGSAKTTTWRLTWLPKVETLSNVQLNEYDYLFKEKTPDLSDVTNTYNKDSKKVYQANGTPELNKLQKSDIIQLERMGFYIVDVPFNAEKPEQPIVLIQIPEGGSQQLKKGKH